MKNADVYPEVFSQSANFDAARLRRGALRTALPYLLRAILLEAFAPFRFPVRGRTHESRRMKVVVFAHTPPPHHGQSYMVELMLKGFANPEYGVECFHVNARFASDSKDIGRFRPGKAFRLLGYCAHAIWLRLRHEARNLYYVPTPTLKNPLIRDWVILLICRPFFRNTIFHWHAAGLGEWIDETLPAWMRRISHMALDKVELSISLGRFNEKDAARFKPRRSVLVRNGIPDPCPDFQESLVRRRARLQERIRPTEKSSKPLSVQVVYLGLCTWQKGFLDAIRGIVLANQICREEKKPLCFELTIAGPFLEKADEVALEETLESLGRPAEVRRLEFVAGAAKAKLLGDSDILCFPTYYYAESFGLVVVEAMAFGMPVVATRWRSVPELLPADYPGLVDIKSPDQIARALIALATRDDSEAFRREYLDNYTVERFLRNLADAFHQVE